jgi:hypothetical protein
MSAANVMMAKMVSGYARRRALTENGKLMMIKIASKEVYAICEQTLHKMPIKVV